MYTKYINAFYRSSFGQSVFIIRDGCGSFVMTSTYAVIVRSAFFFHPIGVVYPPRPFTHSTMCSIVNTLRPPLNIIADDTLHDIVSDF